MSRLPNISRATPLQLPTMRVSLLSSALLLCSVSSLGFAQEKGISSPASLQAAQTKSTLATQPSVDMLVKALIQIGLGRASAEPLAKRIAAGDPDAKKTGALLQQMATRMQAAGVPAKKQTAILEEAAARRLTDASPGGAADGLVGRALIAELVGERTAALLRPGSNAGLVASALFEGIAQLDNTAVAGAGRQAAIDDIVRGGLSGDAAKGRVGGAIIEDLVGKPDAALLPAGTDKLAVAGALLDAMAGLQAAGLERDTVLGREVLQGILRGGLRGATAAQFVKTKLAPVVSAARSDAGRAGSSPAVAAPPASIGDGGRPPGQAGREDASSSGIRGGNGPAGSGSAGAGPGAGPGSADNGGGGPGGGAGGGAGSGPGGGAGSGSGGGAGPGGGGGSGGDTAGGGSGGDKDDGKGGGDSGGGTGDAQSHEGGEVIVDLSGDAGGFTFEELPPASSTPRAPGMEKETGTGLGMSQATGGRLGGQEANNAMRGVDLKAGGGGAAGPGARDATTSGVLLSAEEQRNAATALDMARTGGVTDPHAIDRGGMAVTDRDLKDIGLKGNGGAKGPTESTGTQPVQPAQSPLGAAGGGPIVAPARVPVSLAPDAVPAAVEVKEVVDQVRPGGN